MISNLLASRLTLLHAESGTGKSSLLRAGVASSLNELAQRRFHRGGTARHIPVVFNSWRDNPTADLIQEIQKTIIPFATGGLPAEFPGRVEEAIEAASRATDARLLVMLDQFEEHFLYRSRETQDMRFADELAACINRPDLRANFLISIRDDAYSGLGGLFKGRITNIYGNHLHIENLNREAARQAIVQPITSFNQLHAEDPPVQIEPNLVDIILDALRTDRFVSGQGVVGHDAVAAPYLQLVMMRLWDTELSQDSKRLRLQTLEKLGGAQTIVRTHVDRALDALSDDDREAAADIFRYLITPSGTKIALGESDLAEYTGRSASETRVLLERLASSDTRILRAVPPPLGEEGQTRFEISHDLLGPAILDWSARQRAAQLERKVRVRRKRWWR